MSGMDETLVYAVLYSLSYEGECLHAVFAREADAEEYIVRRRAMSGRTGRYEVREMVLRGAGAGE